MECPEEEALVFLVSLARFLGLPLLERGLLPLGGSEGSPRDCFSLRLF